MTGVAQRNSILPLACQAPRAGRSLVRVTAATAWRQAPLAASARSSRASPIFAAAGRISAGVLRARGPKVVLLLRNAPANPLVRGVVLSTVADCSSG